MTTPEIHTSAARFRHGDFNCTVVSDGPLHLGPARETFRGATAPEIDALLLQRGLPTESVTLEQNLLVVDTGSHLVLFDTGVGTMTDLGRRVYGPQAGQAAANLTAAGISPSDIDVVALTHAHPDHAWGLLDNAGAPLFTNATVIIGEDDYTHFTDPDAATHIANPRVRNQYTGARINLLPYQDRLVRIGHGYQVADGITAVATPGHSPGHLVYEITSRGRVLVVWGDLCHHPLLLARPDWSFIFDGDQLGAAQQRRRIFRRLSQPNYSVLSYHFPFPGLGELRADGEGYAWQPISH
jgi:glyoxylase-like metal-dependent hydrolase (beta-lactamase superfamily II)